MRLATIRVDASRTVAAVRDGEEWVELDGFDISEILLCPDWRSEASRAVRGAGAARHPVDTAELMRPVHRPAKILCCGLNYRDHILETGRETPDFPTLFAKFADTLTDPCATIDVTDSEQVDWEAELAVVVGAPVRGADRREAEAAILGYTAANDVSYRDWQARTLQWLQGKAWDRTTPIGPVLVTADEISPSDGLGILAEIDGEIVQSSNTRELIFDAADLIAYVSQFTCLVPGDIILTGTPGGVGLGRRPQRWLRDGETLSTSIEGIGTLCNRIRYPAGGRAEGESASHE